MTSHSEDLTDPLITFARYPAGGSRGISPMADINYDWPWLVAPAYPGQIGQHSSLTRFPGVAWCREATDVAKWAYVFEHPGTDPVTDRTVLDRAGLVTLLVPVPAAADAPGVCLDLVAEGVENLELCGGFTIAGVAAVVQAVDGRAAVGHVTYAADSLAAATAFATHAAEDG